MNCPDCKGTGKYVGLIAVENCSKCGGIGRELTGCFEKRQVEDRVYGAGNKAPLGVMVEEYRHRIRTDGPMIINLRDLMQRGELTIFPQTINIKEGDEVKIEYTVSL